MKKNTINKIIIWISGIILVFVSLFSNINYSRKYEVQAFDQQSAIQSIALIIAYLANQLLSKGSDMLSSLVITETQQAVTDMMNQETCSTSAIGQCLDPQPILDYLEANPTATTTDAVVLHKAIANPLFDKAKAIARAKLNQQEMSYASVVYNSLEGAARQVPVQNGELMYQYYNGFLGFNAGGKTLYDFKNTDEFSFQIRVTRVNFNYLDRYKAEMNFELIPYVRYSNIAPIPPEFLSADMVKYMFSLSDKALYLVPFWGDKDLAYSVSKSIPMLFEYRNGGMFNTPINITNDWFIPSLLTNYVRGLDDYTLDNSFNLDDDYDYINIPKMNVPVADYANALNDKTYPTPSLIPHDQDDIYVYTPPSGGGNVPVVDIGTGMPLTPNLEGVNDPTTSVPLPGLDDLLDGTYFKDIAVWFSAWLALTISNITQFWNVAWANLTIGINWLGISLKSILDNMLEQLLLPLQQMTINFDMFRDKLGPGIDPILDFLQFFADVVEFGIKFIVHTISFLFDLVALLIGSIFNLLRSTITTFITLIQSLYAFFPTPIRNVANFVFTTLGFALVYKFIRAVLGLKGV